MEVAEKHQADRNEPRRRLSRLIAPAILLAICIGFFWKIVLTNQYTYLENPDLANQVLPWFQFQAGEWHRGRVPLWDPYQYGGQSLIGQAQPGVAYPLNWILFQLPLKNGWIRQSYLHWYLVVIHFMAAWFCYLLARDLKRSRAASIAAGAAFSLGGWMGAIEWPQMLNSAIWAPLVFLYLLRSLRGERPVASAAASGAFLGMAWLGGHHQIPIYLTLATGAVWLFHVFRHARPNWRLARLAALFLVFVVLVGALQTLPAYEYGKLAKRWVGALDAKGWNEPVPYTVHSQYSLIPTSLLGLVIPGYSRHTEPFVGVIALSLALLAMALGWKDSAVRLFVALAAGGLLFSLGRNDVLHGMIYALVPMVEKARTPAFGIFIYHCAIAVLVAYGIDAFRSEPESPWPKRAAIGLSLFGVVLFTITFALVAGQKAPGDDRFMVVALVALLAAALFQGWRKGLVGQRGAVVALLGLMLIEFGNVSTYYWPNDEERDRTIYLRRMKENVDIAAFLRSLPWPVRCEVPDQEIPFNFGDWHGIDQFGGYLASLPVNLLRLPFHNPRAKQLFGVNYSVTKAPPGPNQEEVFQGASGLKVYWNSNAFPRAWAVHEAVKVRQESAIESTLTDASLDLRRKTFLLEDPPPMERCSGADDVRMTRRNSGRVTIEVEMACKGMVILGDSYFPGWVARVDGHRAKIHEAYTAVRGVVVDKGKHRIEMRYLPVSVFLGLGMTLTGVAGAALLAWRSRRKRP